MKKLAFTCAALFVLASCGNENSQKNYEEVGSPAKGDMLVSAALGSASNLIPFIATDQPSHAISGLIYEGLVKYDKNLNLVPNIAEKWAVSEDGLSIEFTLRKDVTFSDDTPLTAHDVMASYNAVINPDVATPYAGDYLQVKQAEVLNDYTFRVTYAKPFAPALSSWTLAILPKHLLEKAPLAENSLKETPVGSGPYMLKTWNRGKEAVLVANPNYFDGEPNITAKRLRVIPDLDTQFLELKAGNLDTMGLKPLQFTRQTNNKKFTSSYNKYKYLGNGYTFMGYNLKHPLFEDINVRNALSHAVNRQEIIDGVLLGQGLPISCPFKPGVWAYNDTILPHAFNPEKAKEMLKNAGWTDTDGDGILDKMMNGEKRDFSFTVVTNQGNPMRQLTAELLQKSFKNIGIKMDIRIQEWSTFVENTIHKKDFEAIILGWSLTPEPDPYDIFHSSKTGPREFNVIGFNNPEADEMMEKARTTFNIDERKKYLDRFQEIIHAEQPYMFLYAPYSLVTLHKRVKNVEEAPAGISHNYEKWYVPANQQLRMAP